MPRHRSRRRGRAPSTQQPFIYPLMVTMAPTQPAQYTTYPYNNPYQPAYAPYGLNWYMSAAIAPTVAPTQAAIPALSPLSTTSWEAPQAASDTQAPASLTPPSNPASPAPPSTPAPASPSTPAAASPAYPSTSAPASLAPPSIPSPSRAAVSPGPPPAVPLIPRRRSLSLLNNDFIISDDEDENELTEEERFEEFVIMEGTLEEDYCTICCEEYEESKSYLGILHNCHCFRWCYVCAMQFQEMGLKCPRCRKEIRSITSQAFQKTLLVPQNDQEELEDQ